MKLNHAVALSILFHIVLFLGLRFFQFDTKLKEPEKTWLRWEENRQHPMSDAERRTKKETDKETVTQAQKDKSFISKDLLTVPIPGEETKQATPQHHRGERRQGKESLAEALRSNSSENGDLNFRSGQTASLSSPEAQQQAQGFLPKDISIGSIESLNSDQSIYYTFNRRIGDKVIWPWAQYINAAYEQMKAQGQLGGMSKTWATVIEVILDKDGNIISVSPLQMSGDYAMDSAPTKAFQQAKKIPNPPKGMIDEDGYIHMTFRFTVYYNPRPNF